MVTTVQTKEIQVTRINDSPGILPFKLGTNYIISNKHTFLHEIDTIHLEESINNLIQNYNSLNSSISKVKLIYKISLVSNYEHLEPLINEISVKFNNIHTHFHSRQKRGLINFGGTVQKWLWGTLNADDGERYDKALTTLKQNQQKIVREVNNQISISKHLIERYSKDIERISMNQKKISSLINTYLPYIENIADQFYKYTSYLTLINQIFLNAHVLITFLDNLENSISFAKLRTIHPDILTTQHLEEIINELRLHHGNGEILNFSNIQSWYSVVQTNCYFRRTKIIFSIEIPIVNPNHFQYFHLFPIPTADNKIIIPLNPFLALQENQFQYMAYPCSRIEDIFICQQEDLKFNVENDCIASIIQDKKTHCIQTPIEPPRVMFNKINDEHLIVISKEDIKFKSHCPDEGYLTIQGNAIITLPPNCTIENGNFKFGSSQSNTFGKPLILPKIDNLSANLKTAKQRPLKIENIPLEEIHSLQRHIEATNQLSIEDVDISDQPWLKWLLLCSVFIIIIFFSLSKLKKFKQSLDARVEVQSKKAENPVTSVFFQPEVTT